MSEIDLFKPVAVGPADFKILAHLFGHKHIITEEDAQVLQDSQSEADLGIVLARMKAFDDLYEQVQSMRAEIKNGSKRVFIRLSPTMASALVDQIMILRVVTKQNSTDESPLERRIKEAFPGLKTLAAGSYG